MPAALMLAPGLWRVPTVRWDLVNSFLVRAEDGGVTLVDTGLKSAPARILAALSEIGSGPADVTTIVLTHAHDDHAGGAAELAQRTHHGITVHEDDAEFVRTGTSAPTDGSMRLGRLMSRVPRKVSVAPVERTMADGELLPGSGLRVHHTPGHSPGHCSLLHEATGTLITGDSIWNMRSRRTWPVLAFCTNAALTQQTAATLADLEYTTAAFTHGPDIKGTGREAIREFLAHPSRFGPAL
jgi:glyoxylase-like metal-dependent hydrolase (beta-lactamase superfamily II)